MIFIGLIICAIPIVLGLSPSTYLDASDQEHLKHVLDNAWLIDDLAQVHYAVGGYKILGLPIPKVQRGCSYLKQSITEESKIEDLYFASAAGKNLDCPIKAPGSAKKTIGDTFKEGASTYQLFCAVGASANLGFEVDSTKVLRLVHQAVKSEDNLISLGYAFHIGSQLKGDMTSIFERIEDAIVQADEVDGQMLQFEGGLSNTAILLSGAYKLAESVNKPIPIKPEQIVKFSKYLMSRKSAQLVKGVYYLLATVKILTNNKFHVPMSITLASSVAVSVDSPKIQVRVTNLMGSDLGSLKVSAVTVTEVASGKSIISNKPLSPVKGMNSVYEIDVMSLKPARGFYKLSLNVEGSDARLVGNLGASLTFKVLSAIVLQDVEIGTADADQSTAPNLKKVDFPNKVKGILEADQHQKLILKFAIKDVSSGKSTKAHQTFVKVTHLASNREIIFIAEADVSGVYKFDVDVSGKNKEFGGMSGKYSLELVIGDACISNPLVWNMIDIAFSFPDPSNDVHNADVSYKVKPEIHHLFHSPDSRPSLLVSHAFTILCLSPLLVLFIGWAKLGVNISNIPLSLSALGFHFGLGAIFALFGLFFLELNMFTTLRYLFMIGTVTFFCGNSMLSYIAGKRKEEEVKMVYGSYYQKAYRFSHQHS